MSIAITGMGIVSAIGLNKEEVLASLLAKRSGIGPMRHLPSAHTELPVGEVPLSNAELRAFLAMPEQDYYEEVSRTALLGVKAANEAMVEAGIALKRKVKDNIMDFVNIDKMSKENANRRIVFVSGTTVGGMDVTERHFLAAAKHGTPEAPLFTSNHFLRTHDCGSNTEQIVRILSSSSNITTSTTISTACSSAANAIIVGAEMLMTGEADIVVAGGTEALSLFHLNGFNSLMILDRKPCRPFDATREGLNLGEGAAYVVMERSAYAAKRGATPIAYLTGYGNACDAFHQTATSANGEGAYLAMSKALAKAGLKPADVQYVNAHGTGTPNNDASESIALQRVFGNAMPSVSSTKSFTGHTTSASGSIETVICLLAMTHNFLPANLGWTTPMDNGITPTMGGEGVELHHVMCNSFGFGGNDSSLVLSKEPTFPADEAFAGGHKPAMVTIEDCCQLAVSEEEPFSPVVVVPEDKIKTLARVKINKVEALDAIREYVKPLEARRMGRLMKASLLSSLQALKAADIAMPDAIVTGTTLGCVDNSEKLLLQLASEGEESVSPTLFMQSTHNTISSNIAIRLGCHGYNITYSHCADTPQWVMAEAKRLIMRGEAKTVLVGWHDESTPLLRRLKNNSTMPEIHSVAMVLSCE